MATHVADRNVAGSIIPQSESPTSAASPLAKLETTAPPTAVAAFPTAAPPAPPPPTIPPPNASPPHTPLANPAPSTALSNSAAPKTEPSKADAPKSTPSKKQPAAEVVKLWKDYKADSSNKELRNKLVERYLPLVRYHGERVWARLPDGIELDDLISAGVFGLMDAIDAFDLTRGVKFETYCVPRIRGAMLDELRSMDWVPRLVRSKASKLGEATKSLEDKHGRHPTEQELAEHMGMSVKDLEKMMLEANAVNLISLNKKWYETDSYKDVSEIDILDDKKGEDPTRRVQKNDLLRLVTKGLNRNERLIIILYYYEELTMKEVGATLDLSESRVSQMHSSIVQRLQGQLARRRPEFSAS